LAYRASRFPHDLWKSPSGRCSPIWTDDADRRRVIIDGNHQQPGHAMYASRSIKIRRIRSHAHKTLFCVLSMMIAIPGSATQPLLDQYADGARTGHIFPSNCCYVELPSNERIQAMRRNEITRCSAFGGPVGMFKREAGQLWLTSLYKCGGELALQEMYPGIETPALAKWLTGTFRTRLDFACYDEGVQPVYAVTQTLIVEKGVIKSVTETQSDLAACKK
jgi:hypothetical protein